MSKRIFIVFGHHNTKTSFNSKIRDTFIQEAKKLGHKIENGKMMFLHQAAEAFNIWHGVKPEINDETKNILDD